VPENIKNERLKILQEAIANEQLEYNKSFIGKIIPVLFEKEGRQEGQIIGKSPYMQSVHISNPSGDLMGKIVNVKITNGLASSLSGELISV
jgi:tRNA-2-methylthio-N6-dimethylallyladenosine synthase